MPTAPTLVAAYTATFVATTGTSSSLSLQSGDIVLVFGVNEGGNSGDAISTPTTTFANGGITLLQTHSAASNCAAGAWTFTVSTTASGTVSGGSSATSTHWALSVFAYRAGVAPTVARSAQAVNSTRTMNYTPSQADSAIAWVLGDWAAGNVAAVVPTPTSHTNVAPGPTAMPESSANGTFYSQYAQVLDDQASTSAVAYGIGGTGTGPFTIIAVEVQGTGGAAPVTPRPPKLVTRNAVMRAAVT